MPISTRPLLHLCFCLCLGLIAAAQAVAAPGTYALTVYGEAPKYPADFKHFDFVNPAAPKGGSLSRASMEIGQFNYILPYLDQGTGVAQVDQWLYSPLAFRSLDEPYTVYGLIAQTMERDPNGLWVRFHLNPAARFADDTPITADDVAFTYNTLMSKGSLSFRMLYGDVKEVLVENPQQILFTFKTNQNRTLALDLASMRILPQHWWQTRNFANGGGFEAPLGSGPYSVAQVVPGRSITFARNPNWWAKDLPVSKGLYNFDRLTVNFYIDIDVTRELLKAAAFDYNREFSATGFTIGYESPALSDGRLQRAVLAKHKPGAAQGFAFNLQNPFFQDRRVRQAISLLWDFEWTNKQMMRNFYVRLQSYFPKSTMAATELPDARELEILEPLRGQVPEEVFTQVYQAPKTDGSGNIRDKQLQALALLKQAGWTPKDNKLVNAQGEQLSFTFLDGQGGFDRMLLPFMRNLAQIGIKMELRKIDAAQYINRFNSRDYDMIAAQFPRSGQPIVSPGREMYDMYGSRSATQPGSSNSMVLRDPAVDLLLDGLVQANSRDEMVHYARALDRVLLWGYYMIPNYYSIGTPTVYQNRFGRPAKEPLYDEGLDSWWEVSKTAQPAAPSTQEGQ
ncbi:extracellular solute-binding protein [Pseudomonas sp. 5P_3.1_Bac2]|uniref:extracellular solute-binding protein n=1 Tax=Pseudomonas sp. 5P_3.1_Bac2 TaxID=2971617 RepID=UPI0021C5912B|nr:extracellular solute-binding protein [Pseudomonas sp. 5P_3.1_Bac2]MCU1717172.1 extracellular solute-binding protein [Pseudomonas sp. 5P_3.1_Bac2]